MDNLEQFKIRPTPKQEAFMFAPNRFSCYSGAYGGGKTVSGCLKALLLSSYPKNFGIIGRNTYPELRDSTQKTFFELCPPEYYDDEEGGRWSPTENHLKLVNGSEIVFRHLDTIAEKELLSMNLGWFFIDQAEEISINVWRVLQSRLRLNRVPKRYGFIACNPEPGTWIYDVFKRPFDENRLTKDYFYVESSSYDNPHLPKEYIQTLIDSYPEELRKRYIQGRWDVFEGQILKEFDRNIHVVHPFDIPKAWERLVSLDHGMVNPTGVLWGAVDFDGNCISPKTKILKKDLRWVQADTIKVGDVLVGFDEQVPENFKRHWHESVVESVKKIKKPSYKLTLSDKTEITCSADHQWLIETLGLRKQWKATEELKPDWKLLRVLNVWEEDTSFGSGYLAAAFDGEGSFGINQRGTMRLSFVQNDNEMMMNVIKELNKRGFRNGNYKTLSSACNILSLTRKRDILRFLGSIRPKRLLPKFKVENLKGFSAFNYPTIIKKEFIGITEVVSIQTSTRTYIAEGIASHNCYIYDEYYKPGIVSDHAREILSKTSDQEISLWVIDPSTQAKTREKKDSTGNAFPWSVIEEYEDNGLFFIPGNNERLASINRIREFLTVQEKRINPRTGEKRSPRLFIFQNCVNLLWEIPQYQWKKIGAMTQRNQREQARDFNDHLIDALRYMIMARFPAPLRKPFGDQMIMPLDRQNANFISKPMQNKPDELLGSFESNPEVNFSDSYE